MPVSNAISDWNFIQKQFFFYNFIVSNSFFFGNITQISAPLQNQQKM